MDIYNTIGIWLSKAIDARERGFVNVYEDVCKSIYEIVEPDLEDWPIEEMATDLKFVGEHRKLFIDICSYKGALTL